MVVVSCEYRDCIIDTNLIPSNNMCSLLFIPASAGLARSSKSDAKFCVNSRSFSTLKLKRERCSIALNCTEASSESAYPQASRDCVIVEPVEKPEYSNTGLVIQSSGGFEAEILGKVVSMGSGQVLATGESESFAIQVGDIVMFDKYGAESMKFNGKQLKVVKIPFIRAKFQV